MANRCCAKPSTTIIEVGGIEVGLTGLDKALHNVFVSGLDDEAQLKSELLRCIRECGNYVTAGREEAYKDALLREYMSYATAMGQDHHTRAAEQRGQSKDKAAPSKRKRWFITGRRRR